MLRTVARELLPSMQYSTGVESKKLLYKFMCLVSVHVETFNEYLDTKKYIQTPKKKTIEYPNETNVHLNRKFNCVYY